MYSVSNLRLSLQGVSHLRGDGTAVKSKCERFIYFGKNIKQLGSSNLDVFCFQLTSESTRRKPPPRRWDGCEVQVERFIYFGKKYKTYSVSCANMYSVSNSLHLRGDGTAVECERFIYFGKNVKH